MTIDIEELKTRLRSEATQLHELGALHLYAVSMADAADAIEQLQAKVEGLEATIAKQAKAAISGMNAAKAHARSMLAEAEKAQAESSPDVLASERAANAALTEELEQLQAENAKLKSEIFHADSQAEHFHLEAVKLEEESRGLKSELEEARNINKLQNDLLSQIKDGGYIGEARGVATEYGGPNVDLSEYDEIERMLDQHLADAARQQKGDDAKG